MANSVASLLSLALFLFFSFIGLALLQLLGSRCNLLRIALMAPSAGVAALVLPLFTLFRLNYPIRKVALPVTILLAVAATGVLWRYRPIIPFRKLRPFLLILAVAFLLTGYPLLLYGFNWVSYVNDDMATYVQAGQYFTDHGLYDLPDAHGLLEGTDNKSTQWFLYAIGGARCGSDLLVAWLVSLTGLTGYQIYMPLMLVFHVALIAALGGFLFRNPQYLWAAVASCAWLALSALNTLGTAYQLMPQVCGVMLLIATSTMLLDRFHDQTLLRSIRWGVLTGVLFSALMIVYYEITPFLAVSFAAYHLILLLRKREAITSAIPALTAALVVVVVALRTWALTAIVFINWQASRSLNGQDLDMSLFPYYLVPSGLGNLWGFLSIGDTNSSLVIDLAIALGSLLLLIAIFAAAWQAWRAEPAAVIGFVMLGLAARLFAGNADYGLFKLAMYIQPFLLSSVVLGWFGLTGRWSMTTSLQWKTRLLPLIAIAGLGLHAQLFYVMRSGGWAGNGLAEVPNASDGRLLDQLGRLRATAHSSVLISDTYNAEMAKVQALYLNPARIEFPSADFFETRMDLRSQNLQLIQKLQPNLTSEANALVQSRVTEVDDARAFDMKTDGPGPRRNLFYHVRSPLPSEQWDYELVWSGPGQTSLNQRHQHPSDRSLVQFSSARSVSNFLVLIASELGASHYPTVGFPHQKGQVSLSPPEPDYFFKNRTMAAVGRYLLFLVVHPLAKVRLVADYTASLNADGENRIPAPVAIGTERVSFATAGRGSGRFFSGPVEPQTIDGEQYLMVDMGGQPIRFPNEKPGLMAWYGRPIRLDGRFLVGFLRDISIITEEEFQAIKRPAALQRFPEDLANPGLEYSGIYEDGWASEDSFAILQAPATASRLRVTGSVPRIAARNGDVILKLIVDGTEVAHSHLAEEDFTLEADAPPQGLPHRVEVRASGAERLPAPDSRPVTFLIRYFGFDPVQPAGAEITGDTITIGQGWYSLEKFAGQTFRWVSNDAAFSIHSPKESAGEVALDLESGPGLNISGFDLLLKGPTGQIQKRHVAAGRHIIQFNARLAEGENTFQLHVGGGGRRSANDPRTLNFRVFKLDFFASRPQMDNRKSTQLEHRAR